MSLTPDLFHFCYTRSTHFRTGWQSLTCGSHPRRPFLLTQTQLLSLDACSKFTFSTMSTSMLHLGWPTCVSTHGQSCETLIMLTFNPQNDCGQGQGSGRVVQRWRCVVDGIRDVPPADHEEELCDGEEEENKEAHWAGHYWPGWGGQTTRTHERYLKLEVTSVDVKNLIKVVVSWTTPGWIP